MNTKRILLVCIGFILVFFGGLVFFSGLEVAAGSINITATVNPVCGNGVLETGEQCDGSNLGGQTCTGLGYAGGTLSCNTINCTFNTSACTSGGGGGGYIAPPVVTQVIFSGRAYPLSKVVVLKDGQIAVSTIAGPDARFEVSITGLATGNYIFALYGEDNQGRRSALFTFSVFITQGATTKISGIFISPTIAVDKSEVKRGDDIAIFGQSTPQGEITIQVSSEEEFFVKTPADKDGVYLYNFDSTPLDMGQHFTKSKAAFGGEISSFGIAVGFAVGTKNVAAAVPTKCPPKADLNNDCRVNLVDFSIAAYWYKRPLSATFKLTEAERLSGDGKIDLVDFSIMAYYWTG